MSGREALLDRVLLLDWVGRGAGGPSRNPSLSGALQLRLKLINALRMYLAPQPVFKLKHSFRIFNTGLCLHAAYVQPLHGTSLRNLGKSGVRPSAAASDPPQPQVEPLRGLSPGNFLSDPHLLAPWEVYWPGEGDC